MTVPITAGAAVSRPYRVALADRLSNEGILTDPAWRATVEAVPREAFLQHWFRRVSTDRGPLWEPVHADQLDIADWMKAAYADDSLVVQLDGHRMPDDVDAPIPGRPTSSATMPSLVVRMLHDLKVTNGTRVLEIGTGSGYSSALLCHRLGVDQVTTIDVDPQVAERADQALEACGYSTWTVTGDGLLGWPIRAPYDRIIVRHEAPCNRVEVKDLRRSVVAAAE